MKSEETRPSASPLEDPASEFEVIAPRWREYPLDGKTLVITPLVIGDFKRAADCLNEIAKSVARERPDLDLSRVNLLEVLPVVVDRIAPFLAIVVKEKQDADLAAVEPGWFERHVDVRAAYDLAALLMEVNGWQEVLGKHEALRRRIQEARAGGRCSTS